MPEDPTKFAIIPCVYPPYNALLVGELDLLMSVLPDTMANAQAIAQIDEAQEQLEAREADLTERAVQSLADGIVRITHRLDELEQQHAERIRLDAEEAERREQQHIQRTLDQLPDPDDPDAFLAQGELTMNPASEPAHEEQLSALDQGALPNELQEGAPADPGTQPIDDPADLGGAAKPRNVVAQPISVSLNEDD